jgi:glycine cleavage system aminomethyltransferase T
VISEVAVIEATLRREWTAYDVYLPAYYGDLAAEYWALVNNVTLRDVTVERVVEISGRTALRSQAR